MNRRQFIAGTTLMGMIPFMPNTAFAVLGKSETTAVLSLPDFIPHVRHSGLVQGDNRVSDIYISNKCHIGLRRERYFKDGFSPSPDDLKTYTFTMNGEELQATVSPDNVVILNDVSSSKQKKQAVLKTLSQNELLEIKEPSILFPLFGQLESSCGKLIDPSNALCITYVDYVKSRSKKKSQILIISI